MQFLLMAQPSAKIRNFIKKIKREYAKVEIRLHSSFLYTLLDVKSLRLNCAQKQVKKSDYGHKNEKGSKNEEPPSSYPTTVVFKIDMHCDECASKIIKCLHAFREGVESLKPEIRTESVDSIKPKDKLSGKTKKNVDIASPAPVTTTLLKVLNLCPCQGVKEVSTDREKGMVMVKGTMDVTALVQKLSEKFRKKVEENEGDGNGKGETEQNNNHMVPACGYGYGEYNYMGQYYPASDMFSDENPYACHIM
ncbi:hypothetical protein ACSQ67_010792 [Phaseolus vulgaris]